MHRILLMSSFAFIAACGGNVPNDVGLGPNSAQARAERDAALAGVSVIPEPEGVVVQPLSATGEAVAQTQPTVSSGSASISNEQDFDAVSSRETIESDAQRLERNREQYEVIQPGALPTRTSTGPNIVYYALNTVHNVGDKQYNRIGFNKQARFDKNCARFPSGDIAQLEFLRRGGPRKDSLGLDPDGDGFACYWDPSPYRLAAQN